MSSGRPARKPPAFTASSIVGNFTVPTSRGSRIAAICSSVKARTAQFAEHLHVLFVMRRRLADRLLAGGRSVELVAERQPLAQFELDAAALVGLLEAEHVPLDRAAFGRPAADHAADAVFRHEISSAAPLAIDK